MREPFGQRLADAVAARGPLCVGVDPHAPLLAKWGLPDSPDGLARFTDAVVDALAGSVAVLKPQAAFYERHGSRGLAVLEDGVARARAAGVGRTVPGDQGQEEVAPRRRCGSGSHATHCRV